MDTPPADYGKSIRLATRQVVRGAGHSAAALPALVKHR
jgi:hypothetical protein